MHLRLTTRQPNSQALPTPPFLLFKLLSLLLSLEILDKACCSVNMCIYQCMRKQKTELWNTFPPWWCCWGLLYQWLDSGGTFCLLWQQQHSIKNCCLSQAWSSILWHSSGILHSDVLKANRENFEQIPCHSESGGKRWSDQNCCSKAVYTPHAALAEWIGASGSSRARDRWAEMLLSVKRVVGGKRNDTFWLQSSPTAYNYYHYLYQIFFLLAQEQILRRKRDSELRVSPLCCLRVILWANSIPPLCLLVIVVSKGQTLIFIV